MFIWLINTLPYYTLYLPIVPTNLLSPATPKPYYLYDFTYPLINLDFYSLTPVSFKSSFFSLFSLFLSIFLWNIPSVLIISRPDQLYYKIYLQFKNKTISTEIQQQFDNIKNIKTRILRNTPRTITHRYAHPRKYPPAKEPEHQSTCPFYSQKPPSLS